MNEQEQRIAIAEALGWTWKRALNGERYAWFSPADERETDWYIHQHYGRACEDGLPDYLHDLNAMHEAEKALTPETRPEYLCQLFDCATRGLAGLYPIDINYLAHHATAAQRAEAFLRTVGKWKD